MITQNELMLVDQAKAQLDKYRATVVAILSEQGNMVVANMNKQIQTNLFMQVLTAAGRPWDLLDPVLQGIFKPYKDAYDKAVFDYDAEFAKMADLNAQRDAGKTACESAVKAFGSGDLGGV